MSACLIICAHRKCGKGLKNSGGHTASTCQTGKCIDEPNCSFQSQNIYTFTKKVNYIGNVKCGNSSNTFPCWGRVLVQCNNEPNWAMQACWIKFAIPAARLCLQQALPKMQTPDASGRMLLSVKVHCKTCFSLEHVMSLHPQWQCQS